ncbi:MAG TPA: BatA domain-containing protein [Vicinamibacterales bacterium]|jgi:hypothetical protein|nr:BatA domain-containing protein [Vicinamibacterales bacterium]
MGLVAPFVLAALAALAIPILIHLIQREKNRVVEFPSLMFLRRIPYRSVRRRRIRHWALLLMRLAALALIVFAFARPFFRRDALAAATQNGTREVAILVDTSYSMGYADRWSRARDAARTTINGLAPGDRASLIFFSDGANAAVRSSTNRAELSSALTAASPGPGATRFAPALKLAGSLLSESALPRREVVLISDFQRRGWDSSAGKDDVRLPDRTVVTPIAVTSNGQPNLTALPATLQRTRFENQDRVAVTAGVVNHGASAARVPVTLEISGRSVQTQNVEVGANGSASVTFAPFTVASRNMRGTVRIPADGLARDNVSFFIASPLEPVHFAIVDRTGAEREAFYAGRAAAIGEQPRVDVVNRTPETLADADFASGAVILLNDIPVSDALAARLQRFVAGGGGLFVAAGPHATWPSASKDVLPAMPAGIVDRTTGAPLRLGGLEYSHPVFEIFRAPRSGDFSAPRFYAYRALDRTDVRALARFDDGAPALVEKRSGSGRVLLWTSTLDLGWTDLPVKPVFLPFLQSAVKYLADFSERPASSMVGQVVAVPAPRTQGGKARVETVAIAPSGAHVSLAAEDGALELAEQGFYDVRTQGAPADSAVTIASNVDPGEADLTPIDPKELIAAITGRVGDAQAAAGPRPTADAQAEAQRIWWYLLLAAGLLLMGETLLSNHLSKA